jgi:hypothetical protein
VPQSWGDFAALTVVLGAVIGTVWFAIRYLLVPYLRSNLIEPLEAVRKQVGDNGGKNDPPTLPDRFHTVQESVTDLREVVDSLSTEIQLNAHHRALMQANLSSLVLVLDEHLRWSRTYVAAQEKGEPLPPFDHDPDQEG